MSEYRKYTATEVGRMRAELEFKFSRGGMGWREGEMERLIEDRLRTLILAGLGPEDIDNEREH